MKYIRPRRALLILCVAGFYGRGLFAFGQEPKPAESAEVVQLRLWREHYVELAATYKFLVGDEKPREAKFRREPLHFFSNPAGGTQSHGSLFVWTMDEQPIVIGALWSRKIGETRRASGSFHSTSFATLQGFRNAESFWSPRESFKMKLWPQSTAIAASPPKRLVQMRNMMRALEATRVHKDQRSKLRVLPQPLYRYQSREVIDGAVFGFFENWDPELFVLVEARKEPSDHWMIGMVRFSNKQLSVKHVGRAIWNFDPEGDEPPLGGANFGYVSESLETRPHLFDTKHATTAEENSSATS